MDVKSIRRRELLKNFRIMPTYLPAHCQSPTIQHYNQSYVKELAKPTHEQNFKNFLLRLKEKKLKHANTRATQTEKENEVVN